MVPPQQKVRSLRHRDRWLEVEEQMDRPDAGEAATGGEMDRALAELGFVHRWLGGARGTRRGLDDVRPGIEGEFTLLDVGCGGGDLASVIEDWSHKYHLTCRTILVDFNRSACLHSSRRSSQETIVLQADAYSLPIRPRSVDIVHCGLFLHHFTTQRAACLLQRLLTIARLALIVNDLHRHDVPYLVTRLGARLLSRSEMVRHDAPVSVGRGFRRIDLENMAAAAGFRWTLLRRVWPYRWLAVKMIQPAFEPRVAG